MDPRVLYLIEQDDRRVTDNDGVGDQQGPGLPARELGWFMAAAASLAEYPERIKKLFANNVYPKEGIFEITFYMKGEPIKVVIDDRIPTASNAAIHA